MQWLDAHREAIGDPHNLPLVTDLLQSRYDQVVRGLGGHGEYVERPEDLSPALQRAFSKAERNALQKYVFPRLRELCLQHGCRFQAIALR